MIASKSSRLFLLAGIVIALVSAVFLFPPTAQDPAYNNFADQRGWLGIPNFLNVISNVPFLFIGAMGLWILFGSKRTGEGAGLIDARERWAYGVTFLGIALTAFGSTYYHWNPTNQTLVWDRLPMTVGFMGLFSAVAAERISVRLGYSLLWPLVAAGIASVAYWNWTETHGRGDLRPYIVVQYGSMIVLLLMIAIFPPRYSRGYDFVVAIAFYGAAKVFEILDKQIFAMGRIVSGHTLKHLAAAIALVWLVRMLRLRHRLLPLSAS